MKKLMLIIALILNFASFASSGNGVGNGGLGYICETSNPSFPKATITLDMMEMLDTFYEPNYFINYQGPEDDFRDIHLGFHTYYQETVRRFRGTKLPNKVNYVSALYAKNINLLFKDAFNKEVDLNLNFLKDLFSKEELKALHKAKKQITKKFDLYFTAGPRLFENFTEDTGEINRPTLQTLKNYGLNNCKLVQVFVLNFLRPIYETKETNFFLGSFVVFSNPARYLDSYSFKALLWHEVIYYGLNDVDSSRTRKLVQKILKELYL